MNIRVDTMLVFGSAGRIRFGRLWSSTAGSRSAQDKSLPSPWRRQRPPSFPPFSSPSLPFQLWHFVKVRSLPIGSENEIASAVVDMLIGHVFLAVLFAAVRSVGRPLLAGESATASALVSARQSYATVPPVVEPPKVVVTPTTPVVKVSISRPPVRLCLASSLLVFPRQGDRPDLVALAALSFSFCRRGRRSDSTGRRSDEPPSESSRSLLPVSSPVSRRRLSRFDLHPGSPISRPRIQSGSPSRLVPR